MNNKHSELIKIKKKVEIFDKRNDIFLNGIDNDYPEKIDRYINNSVTAKRGANVVSSFILGKGFPDFNKFKVNKKKNLNLFQLTDLAANSLSRQSGIFIHVNYFIDVSIKSLDVLPFNHGRVGKKDDNDYNGKILVKDWLKTAKESKPVWFDVYNPDPRVVKSQIKKAGGINKYKGQVLFVNLSNYIYPLSKLDPVRKDADSESQISIFKNVSLRKGFFGKQLVITQPFTDGDISDNNDHHDDEHHNSDHHHKDPLDLQLQGETERTNFRNSLRDFIGAENIDGILHLEMDLVDEDIEKTILFKNIESNIDDKLFAHTEKSISENISVAFGVPLALLKTVEKGLFGQSGEALKQMKLFVQEETSKERTILGLIINDLMIRFRDFKSTQELVIEPLIEEENVNTTD